ncbi:MAG: RagB/SusD family nutrient uptake outer membrane protein [Sphingobacterium sp.]|jgi:hypothetical protein|nr:RagB/SusD family nutrient uptake outer membrane protein [Sphingobacterium sp.]
MNKKRLYISLIASLFVAGLTTSCEKSLDETNYDKFGGDNFYKTAEQAKMAVTAVYSTLNPDDGYSIWGCGLGGIVPQSSSTTDELVCSWGWPGWPLFNTLNLSETFPGDALFVFYNTLMPSITNSTIAMEKLSGVQMDEKVKQTYIGELKALRAHYSWILYSYYGPVPIILDPVMAQDPNATSIPRPSREEMVKQIEKDYKEALDVLPAAADLATSDYGRFTKDACLMGLLKLYMQEKRWNDVMTVGHEIQQLGHSLKSNYADIFSIENNGDNKEVLFALPTRIDSKVANIWLAHALPGNYADPSGKSVTQWGGYKMPWKTYDKFESTDKRKQRLLATWKTDDGKDFDARANNYIGAIPMKYGLDPSATGEKHGVNIVVWRYADVLLSLAEAINETSGPTQEAYDLVRQVRERAGLKGWEQNLSKEGFRNKMMDERLFEFWCEGGIRREDLIRWGTYIDRAKADGSKIAKPEFVLWPIPRKAINESNGVIKQNPGYN